MFMETLLAKKKKIVIVVLMAMLIPPMGWIAIILGSQLMNFNHLMKVLVNPVFYAYCLAFIGFMFWRVGKQVDQLITYIKTSENESANELIRRIPQEFLIVTMIYGACGPPSVCTGVGLSIHDYIVCWILGPIVISTCSIPFYNRLVILVEDFGSQIPVKTEISLSLRKKLISSVIYLNIGVISMLAVVFYNMVISKPMGNQMIDQEFLITLICFALGGIGLISIPLVLQTNHMEKSLKKASNFITTTSEGNLGEKLSIDSRDELGVLISSTNNLLTILVQLISSIQQEMKVIHKISEEFSEISTGVNNVSQNLNRNLESLSDFSHKQNQEVTKFNNLSSQLTQYANHFQNATQKGSKKYDEFHQSFDLMKDKLDVINNITRQTKMLAINAAIEAKSAGEAGLGFQVIAQEIGRLSDLTQQLSSEVEDQTIGVEQSALAMKTLIFSLEKVANDVHDIVHVINTSNTERTTDVKGISELVSELQNLIHSSNINANKLVSGSESLEDSTNTLSKFVEYFKIQEKKSD